MNASCREYEWVMSHMNEQCRTFEYVVPHIQELGHTRMHQSRDYESVMRHFTCMHFCMRHVAHLNESWCTFEWVMVHIWMSRGTHLNESWYTFEWVMVHIWMSHGTHLNESWCTFDWVMVNESWCAFEWVMVNESWYTFEGVLVSESWRTCEWVMSHICMRLVARVPQTGEIGLTIITTAKISNQFSRHSPYISNTFSRESPNFQANSHVSKRNPRHSKDLTGKLLDLEIQIF